ncbi:hypothetical protein BB561_005376 [Smittium simulii]|uniref:ER membrane protein complex subunit 6 n=1 Tax=Smittium simulii TaxID=133385 RepID=A0A2T9YAR2_9FUNG|nr:hypothetical protein BB561_005376 [Smittium simulii]
MADSDSQYLYFEPLVQKNRLTLSNIQTLAIWATGATSGILGIDGWMGFAFFALSWILISSLICYVKARGSSHLFFKDGIREIFVSSLFGSLLTYILVWTLFYGLVNIYE